MSFRDELFVEALSSPEDAPRSGRARLIMPQVVQILWDSEIALEFDPPAYVLAWVPTGEDTQIFLVRVKVSTLPEPLPSTDGPGGQLSLAAAAVVWSLLHRDIPEDEAEREGEGAYERQRRQGIREAAVKRVRSAFAKMAREVDDG